MEGICSICGELRRVSQNQKIVNLICKKCYPRQRYADVSTHRRDAALTVQPCGFSVAFLDESSGSFPLNFLRSVDFRDRNVATKLTFLSATH
jgi:hypothetical protein